MHLNQHEGDVANWACDSVSSSLVAVYVRNMNLLPVLSEQTTMLSLLEESSVSLRKSQASCH